METNIPGDLHTHFQGLANKRRGAGKWQKLIDILITAKCWIICVVDDWSEIEEYGEAKKEWLEQSLELTRGIPSHDTFGRVFAD